MHSSPPRRLACPNLRVALPRHVGCDPLIGFDVVAAAFGSLWRHRPIFQLYAAVLFFFLFVTVVVQLHGCVVVMVEQ